LHSPRFFGATDVEAAAHPALAASIGCQRACLSEAEQWELRMPLHIRDDRAADLARRLAGRKGVTMTEAVIGALEDALAREERPLAERIAEIADEAERLGNRARGRTPTKQEIDELWGNE
jgi:antitoxin VapB